MRSRKNHLRLNGLKFLGYGLVFLLSWVIISTSYFFTSERTTQLGPFSATVAPTLSGWGTVEAGPLFPSFRYPLKDTHGLGVTITLKTTEAATLTETASAVSAIGASPKGEIAHVKSAIRGLAFDSLWMGFIGSFIPLFFLLGIRKLLGSQRRSELYELMHERGQKWLIPLGLVGLLILSSSAPIVSTNTDEERWQELRVAFPSIPSNEFLNKLQIEKGVITSEIQILVQGAIDGFAQGKNFYNKLAVKVNQLELRQPQEGESTALVVTDRHDNIGMDPVARAVGDSVKARLVLNLGDDTSSGADWEEFSINSFVETFKGYSIVSISGNHDNGKMVKRVFEEAKVPVLKGKPRKVEGLRLIGDSDPRATQWGKGYLGNDAENKLNIQEVDKALTEDACKAFSSPTVALVHSPASAEFLEESGCVKLILSGHLHRQVGPKVVEGERGSTYTLTTGTTGGAAFAFALGSKLRRDAQMTVLTYNESGPVGLQVLTFTTGGEIKVGDYYPLSFPPQTVEASP